MSKSVAKKVLPATNIIEEGSWGERKLGKHASTMELFLSERFVNEGFIEWDIPSLNRGESIGLWWDAEKNLLDYDGVFSLPTEAIEFLEEQGFKVSEEFKA